jgi:hypothetical protein
MSAPFAIDPATGRLRLPDLDLDLTPGMPQAAFISATSRLNRDNLGANDGWQRYSMRELISGDRKLGLFLIFFDGRLNKLSFAWSQKDETWDDWSEASEAARQRDPGPQELRHRYLDRLLAGKKTLAVSTWPVTGDGWEEKHKG